MNTPNPLLPQGSLPQRGKSTIYFKILMIVAIHTVLIGGILMVGCKDANKDHASTTPPDDTATAANTASNSSPMSTDLPAPVAATPAPNTIAAPNIPPAQPVVSTPMPPANLAASPIVPPATPLITTPATPGVAKEYVIVSGDLLSTIAKRNGVSLKALEDANPGLDPKKLRIGNKLQIPASSGTVSTTSSSATAPASGMADSSTPASGDTTTYTVKSGDILLRIAHSHGTTVKAILAMNDMKTTSIKTGQKLKLPVMKVASADTTPAAIPAATSAPAVTTPAPIDAPATVTAPKTTVN